MNKEEKEIMKEYLIVYMEYEEIYDENGYVINKIPYIKNEIIKANNIKEIIEEKFFYEVLNIIEIGDSNE